MPVAVSDRKIVDDLFKAMQAGPSGEKDMLALYADDAVIVEPFSGEPKTHAGRAAIRQWFIEATTQGPPLTLALDRVDMDGVRVRAEWTCTSPAFSGPMRGVDLFTIRNGKIARLEIEVTEMPPMGPH